MGTETNHDSETGLSVPGRERRLLARQSCTRLVVIRLPCDDGTWRWFWVSDISPGGLAVSFLVRPEGDTPIQTTLLDVDCSLSFSVAVRFARQQEEPPTRTGFEFVETDPGLERWVSTLARGRSRRGDVEGPGLWNPSPRNHTP